MKMNYKLLLSVILTTLIVSCNGPKKVEETNPLLVPYNTEFNVPPFEKILPEHYLPAFEKGIAETREAVAAIINNNETPDYENTIVALDKSNLLLSEVARIFFSATSANTNDEIRKIEVEVAPMMASINDEILLNNDLFKRVEAVYNKKDELNLTSEQLFILENIYKGFIREGAGLNPEGKEKLKEYNQKLSVLTVKVSQNVLAETNSYKLVISDEKDLDGLPQSVKDGAAEAAASSGLEGQWVFTTQKPSMLPFLQYSNNRDLRKKLYSAYSNRGNNDNDNDNKELISQIMELRAERANLLGYKTHSNLVLEPRMAGNPENVIALLDKLWARALPMSKKELNDMQLMVDKEGGNFKIEASDWWYYAEKVRKEKFDLDDSSMRPYFLLENVRNGAFEVATRLFGITFKPLEGLPVPHPEAQAFEVCEEDGTHLGILYMDFHPRESKGQGAWCGTYREHTFIDGVEDHPIVTLVCNFTRPSGDTPSLLSMDEVSTLFHEFGHALDALFSKATYNRTFIAWDFVELPSQIMEHWVTEPQVLEFYARHYKTEEIIPQEMVEKIKKSGYFNQGFETVEYLAASYLDIAWHTIKPGALLNVPEFEKKTLDKLGLIPEILPRYKSTYFLHMTGGYDSGYYSYIWAAVLDNDAFEAFKEKGIFDRETASSFRTNILEKNGIMDAMEMFTNFRGRKPDIEPLLKNRGLN